jgi:hypothetical protein
LLLTKRAEDGDAIQRRTVLTGEPDDGMELSNDPYLQTLGDLKHRTKGRNAKS